MTETERLRAVAKFYRDSEPYMNPDIYALADLFDGIAERHKPWRAYFDGCFWCTNLPGGKTRRFPCPDVRAALAVADALGLGESQEDSTGLPGTGRVQ